MLEVAQHTTIHLLGDCAGNDTGFCRPLEEKIRGTVDRTKYRQGAALMEVPESLEEWRSQHRTARKRSDRCERLGYEFSRIDYAQFSDDIYEINTSLLERQGRPMSDGYRKHHRQGSLPHYPCELHNIRTYGVLRGSGLYAYMTLYRINELALVSMILGHGDFLRDDIMYLLFTGMLKEQAELGGWFYYNRWDSGQEGLRYYKEKLGFHEGDIRWEL